MKSIAFIDGGTYYHHATYHDPELARYFAASIYAPELNDTDLAPFDCLYVASRQEAEFLVRAKRSFDAFLAAGKTVVVMSDTCAEDWVPGVRWQPAPVNFWWWLTPGADSGLRLAAPDHSLVQAVGLDAFTWHQHGYLLPPAGAVSLVDLASGGSVFYEDRVSTPGRLLVSTLDPCYHHGSYFMPATTRFLRGFLPWLAADDAG
jgi:hypothetical protein